MPATPGRPGPSGRRPTGGRPRSTGSSCRPPCPARSGRGSRLGSTGVSRDGSHLRADQQAPRGWQPRSRPRADARMSPRRRLPASTSVHSRAGGGQAPTSYRPPRRSGSQARPGSLLLQLADGRLDGLPSPPGRTPTQARALEAPMPFRPPKRNASAGLDDRSQPSTETLARV